MIMLGVIVNLSNGDMLNLNVLVEEGAGMSTVFAALDEYCEDTEAEYSINSKPFRDLKPEIKITHSGWQMDYDYALDLLLGGVF